LADWQQAPAAPVLRGLRLKKIMLDLPRPELRARIAKRFEVMMDEGALAEARALNDLDPALPAAKLLGLKSLIALDQGTLSKDEALVQAITATRQFAKRQMTWFRQRMRDYVWINPYESNIMSLLR
jgi:tRNA dimethylallyltransferase